MVLVICCFFHLFNADDEKELYIDGDEESVNEACWSKFKQ